jgi:hypothetical protein
MKYRLSRLRTPCCGSLGGVVSGDHAVRMHVNRDVSCNEDKDKRLQIEKSEYGDEGRLA